MPQYIRKVIDQIKILSLKEWITVFWPHFLNTRAERDGGRLAHI